MKRSRLHVQVRQLAQVALGLLSAGLALGQSLEPQSIQMRSSRQVFISIPDRKLAVLEDGKVVSVFPVAVGAVSSPSPVGDFHIVNRVANPTYYHPGVVIPPGPDNPLGSRWLGLDVRGFGIHGTNDPRSVGKAASHGCIRLRDRDLKQFFALVRVGDRVRIVSERDAQVAQVFGGVVTANIVAEVHPSGESQNAGGQ